MFTSQRISGSPEHSRVAPDDSQHTTRRLCARCRSIDFAPFSASDSWSLDLGVWSSWDRLQCDLCELLAFAVSNHSSQSQAIELSADECYWLWSSNFSDVDEMGVIGQAFVALRNTVPGNKYTLCNLRRDGGGEMLFALVLSSLELPSKTQITSPLIDFDLVKKWLAADTLKTTANVKGDSCVSNSAFAGLKGLRVIDCTNVSLVQLPPHSPYITLSYVWGTHSSYSLSDRPATIKDSIIVCLKLGHRYLWVDRYCNAQLESEEKAIQIRQMDKVYSNSTFTIVACAGKDPRHGLPGVTKPRHPRPSVFVEGTGYVQRIPEVRDIKKSVWAKRGWTYQESSLSRARLYFTDHQVYYESSGSPECEWLSLAGGLIQPVMTVDPWNYAQPNWLTEPEDIYECISEFSRRTLKVPQDKLNAFLSILSVYERVMSVGHLYGLPFMSRWTRLGKLKWQPLPTLSRSLMFTTVSWSVRCEELPSWSWVGWSGVHDFPAEGDTDDFDERITLESESERGIAFEEYEALVRGAESQPPQLTGFIHVQAYQMPIRSIDKLVSPLTGGDIYTTDIDGNTAIIHFEQFDQDGTIDKMNRNGLSAYSLIRFPHKVEAGRTVAHLVIRNVSGTHWERVMGFWGPYTNLNKECVGSVAPGELRTWRIG